MPVWTDGFDRTDGASQIKPVAEYQDPVNKMRVSNPQSLIDTDFEYGLQPTKWDIATLASNRPTLFYDPTAQIPSASTITGIASAGTTIITVSMTGTLPAAGTFVYVQDSLNPLANGFFMVRTSGAGTFTYNVTANVPAAALRDPDKTYIYTATPYTGAAIEVSPAAGVAFTFSGTTVTCTTTTTRPHGLHVGALIAVRGTDQANVNGNWVVSRVPSANTFVFIVLTTPAGTITPSAGALATLYARPNSFSIHRAFDGGVQFSAGSGSVGNQNIRQTRRYFRYQSGKGIQFSTGTSLGPAFYVDNITRAATGVYTFNFRFTHEMGVGAQVLVENFTPAALNGAWTILTIPTDTSFTATPVGGVVPDLPAGTYFPSTSAPLSRVMPLRWFGSQNRTGMFDLQNGVFFEYDGQELSVVRRSSTAQLSGTAAVTNAATLVVGTGTSFATQLRVNDNIVIRGMTYRVDTIVDNTNIHVIPPYRGATASNTIVTRTVDIRVPQRDWNIDKMDGTGQSGYAIDITKMQMFYIDYSWYGAGFIRWGLRAADGTVRLCHRMLNNNVNVEAYMRSGNLPAHYESSTLPLTATLVASLAAATLPTDAMFVDDASRFPPSGTVRIRQPTVTGAVEYINYTGRTNTTLTGLTRGVSLGGAAQTFTVTATTQIPVELITPTSAAAVAHWGSSVIMDGRYDDDQSFVFNAGNASTVNIPAGQSRALLSIRLAPSVDSGLTGILGAREIINRMQLKLRSIGLLSQGNTTLRLNLVLNGTASGGTFAAVGGSSLCQVCLHGAGVTVSGGESIAGYFLNVSGGSNFTTTTADLALVRDLGNSILGGATSLTVPTTVNNMYPDGPDVVHVVLTNTGSTSAADVVCRLSWTEAQA